eukprot:2792311-Alexandrium_andersonii.AAC.1
MTSIALAPSVHPLLVRLSHKLPSPHMTSGHGFGRRRSRGGVSVVNHVMVPTRPDPSGGTHEVF